MDNGKIRCPWAESSSLMQAYHDSEWGKPCHDDTYLFEMLTLEGAQAGLSWQSILQRREGYRQAFHQFQIHKVAEMTDEELEALRENPGIIRNRLKIYSVRKNARVVQALAREWGSFDAWIWHFTEGKPIVGHWKTMGEVPAESDLSRQISRELKKRGASFVGPVIIYSFLQAVGIVNDHLEGCLCRKDRYEN